MIGKRDWANDRDYVNDIADIAGCLPGYAREVVIVSERLELVMFAGEQVWRDPYDGSVFPAGSFESDGYWHHLYTLVERNSGIVWKELSIKEKRIPQKELDDYMLTW